VCCFIWFGNWDTKFFMEINWFCQNEPIHMQVSLELRREMRIVQEKEQLISFLMSVDMDYSVSCSNVKQHKWCHYTH
jgi:hypothetical protein